VRKQGHRGQVIQKRIPSLDGLRGVSILLVLLSHSTLAVNFPQRLRYLGGLGRLGVIIFFVISGFLITTLLMREKAKTGQISLRDFYIRRVLRIFPVAYFYIAVVALLSFLGLVRLHRHDLFFALTYLMGYRTDCAWIFLHFWSLTAEEQFYFVWPALVVFLGFRKSFTAAMTYIVIVLSCRVVLSWLSPEWPSAFRFPRDSEAIVVGCMCAIKWEWLRDRKGLFASGSFSFLLLLAVGLQVYLWSIHSRFHVPMIVIVGLVGLWVFRSVEVPNDLIGRILNSRALSSIGVLSYSLYIWQEMFLVYSPTTRTVIPWNLAATLGAALLSYYLIERPFVRLKDRFTRSSRETRGISVTNAISQTTA